MKTFNIDFETVDGLSYTGVVEIQGTLTVRENTTPLEGVSSSSLSLSNANARKLHGLLSQCLADIDRGT